MEPKQLGGPAPPSEPPEQKMIDFVGKTYNELRKRQIPAYNLLNGARMSVDDDAQCSASVELSNLDIRSGKRHNGDQFLELMSETDIQKAMSKNTADKEAAKLELIVKDERFSTSGHVAESLQNLLFHSDEENGSLIQIAKWDKFPV